MKILIINGPNINMLGKRDPKHYGSISLKDIERAVKTNFSDHEFSFFQSNHEGALIDELHKIVEKPIDGLIYNFGGYTHTSVALRDALDMVPCPKVEVHLSNIHAREDFRKESLTGEVSDGIITGFGMYSYFLGVHAVIIKNRTEQDKNLPSMPEDEA